MSDAFTVGATQSGAAEKEPEVVVLLLKAANVAPTGATAATTATTRMARRALHRGIRVSFHGIAAPDAGELDAGQADRGDDQQEQPGPGGARPHQRVADQRQVVGDAPDRSLAAHAPVLGARVRVAARHERDDRPAHANGAQAVRDELVAA